MVRGGAAFTRISRSHGPTTIPHGMARARRGATHLPGQHSSRRSKTDVRIGNRSSLRGRREARLSLRLARRCERPRDLLRELRTPHVRGDHLAVPADKDGVGDSLHTVELRDPGTPAPTIEDLAPSDLVLFEEAHELLAVGLPVQRDAENLEALGPVLV